MLLDDYKIKKTKQRLYIFNYFINNKNIEIKDLIENFNYDESTIYRIINLFLEKNIISKKVNNNKIIYNLHSNHKHILKCTKCKKEELIDCPYENIDLKGFKLENKVINGICKDCQVKRIGVFVGSFDPITNAHLEIANLLLKQDLVDTILLVPCNSFKNTIDIKTRLDMINLICTDNIISSDIEIINGRRNFSYKNMDEIKNMYPNDKLFIILGSDNLVNLNNWDNSEYLLSEYQYIVLERDNIDNKTVIDTFYYKHRKNIKVVKFNNNISSTLVRNNIKNNISISNLVDSRIESYIKTNNLYMIDKK